MRCLSGGPNRWLGSGGNSMGLDGISSIDGTGDGGFATMSGDFDLAVTSIKPRLFRNHLATGEAGCDTETAVGARSVFHFSFAFCAAAAKAARPPSARFGFDGNAVKPSSSSGSEAMALECKVHIDDATERDSPSASSSSSPPSLSVSLPSMGERRLRRRLVLERLTTSYLKVGGKSIGASRNPENAEFVSICRFSWSNANACA